MNTVYPIGYSTDGAENAIDRMMASGTVMLVDTRYSPKSRMPQWREEALRAKYGARYRRAGAYLGNKNYQGGPIEIANPAVGIAGLCRYLDEGFDLILLCQCPDYDSCHRKVIVELLVAQKPEVVVAQSVVTTLVAEASTYQCISVRQPYADWLSNPDLFIQAGIPPKTIENRSWNTFSRGFLLIHASKAFEEDALDAWVRRFPKLEKIAPMEESGYVKGAIVGCAELFDVVQESDDPWFCGEYGFVLKNARPLAEPIPLRGQLKIFSVARSLVDEQFA